ncbi:MAG: Rrf2 family transcriptional regulator [Eubacterium sp.]|nr:Rrf2 family transcriptional regulator [Eubacterium sp.]
MISTKGRYAIRVMIDLAENRDKGPIPLKDISARQDISKKYLEIIAKSLVSAELIIGASGKGGGYTLSRSPEQYSVGEIIEAVEDALSPVACLSNKEYECKRKGLCKTLPMWIEYEQLTHDFFYSKKLSDFL